MAENLVKLLPTIVLNPETQAFILAGLCCLGAWVFLVRFIQFFFSIMWPFMLFGAFVAATPNWSSRILMQDGPEYLSTMSTWLHSNFAIFSTIKEDANL